MDDDDDDSPQGNFIGNAPDICPWCEFQNTNFRLQLHLAGANELNLLVFKGPLFDLSCSVDTACKTQGTYHKISNIRRTKSQNLNASLLVLHLPLPNLLKPDVK